MSINLSRTTKSLQAGTSWSSRTCRSWCRDWTKYKMIFPVLNIIFTARYTFFLFLGFPIVLDMVGILFDFSSCSVIALFLGSLCVLLVSFCCLLAPCIFEAFFVFELTFVYSLLPFLFCRLPLTAKGSLGVFFVCIFPLGSIQWEKEANYECQKRKKKEKEVF